MRMNAVRMLSLVTVLILGQLAAASNISPVKSKPYGQSYGAWSARFWEWAFSLPVDAHPLFDTADCSAGQSGNVWFIGGTFAAIEISPGVILGQADRECRIPSGTALFVPLINNECSSLEGNGETEEDLRECANYFADFIDPSSLFLIIDGKPVKNPASLRVDSPLSTYGPLPDNNLLGAPEGETSLFVADGYHAIIPPLSVGTHTIEFGGVADYSSIGGPVFIQDISYTVTVVQKRKY